jgi:hypothetical protein
MPFLRRSPLAALTVDLLPGNRVAVSIAPGPARTQADAGADRLMLPLGLAALALARASEDQAGSVRAQLRHAAGAVADPQLAGEEPATLCIAVSGLQLEEPGGGGGGGTRMTVQLVRSALGPVPTLGRATPPAPLVANAATAALAVALAPACTDVRLAAALAVEGLMGWYAIADPHLQPPQQAIAYALRHAVARLEEENRTPPPALADAVRMQRAISPMAGGA